MENNINLIDEEIKILVTCTQYKINDLINKKEKLLFEDKEVLYIGEHFVTNDYKTFINYCISNNIKLGYKTYLNNLHKCEFKFD